MTAADVTSNLKMNGPAVAEEDSTIIAGEALAAIIYIAERDVDVLSLATPNRDADVMRR